MTEMERERGGEEGRKERVSEQRGRGEGEGRGTESHRRERERDITFDATYLA